VTTAGLRAASTLAGRYATVVESLSAEEWSMPSGCAGWTVRNLVAHTGSALHGVAQPPQTPPDPALTAEQQQEALVRERDSWSAAEVAAEFLAWREPALAVFAVLQDEPTASAPITLADLGTYPTHALADAFAFDMWCHLYVDLLAPHGPVAREVPEPEHELLAPGVWWMLTGLPQMCPPVWELLDRPLGLTLTGPGGGAWTLRPGSPVPILEEGISGAAAVATSGASDFVRWGTARSPWRESVSLSGDEDYAMAVLDAVNIV